MRPEAPLSEWKRDRLLDSWLELGGVEIERGRISTLGWGHRRNGWTWVLGPSLKER